jgi:hypothetical protein
MGWLLRAQRRRQVIAAMRHDGSEHGNVIWCRLRRQRIFSRMELTNLRR